MAAQDDDLDVQPQQNLALPWTFNPATSWLDYSCWIEVLLDPGVVLHKTLPQTNPASTDTLATIQLQDFAYLTDADADPGKNGVNMAQVAQGSDTIQRMATSTYWFTVLGYGLRAGYQVPIPGLVKVGGVVATPQFPHRAYNKVVGNFSGIPVFFAEWELHYVLSSPMQKQAVAPVPPNMAARIQANIKLPVAVLLPLAPQDQSATTNPVLEGFPALKG
jgi:hypothetical protein